MKIIIPGQNILAWIAGCCLPLLYCLIYAPYGMDSTDFGFFYAYPWRLLQGQVPYRDFYFITPPAALYWHAFWMLLTPEKISVLAGKLSLVIELAAAAWMGALYLASIFDLKRMQVPVPLLAALGFVWGIHSFPPMPWHTVDGVFFGAAALYAGISGCPVLAGMLALVCMLTKQSYLFVPFALLLMIFCCRPGKKEVVRCVFGMLLVLAAHYLSLRCLGAWEAFCRLTSGQLDVNEALKAGIFIYIKQNWLLPAVALLPWLLWRIKKSPAPFFAQPVPLYFILLACMYIYEVFTQKGWIGFGDSWPTLCMVAGGLAVLFPTVFFSEHLRDELAEEQARYRLSRLVRASVAFGALLVLSWSVAISGGYKSPAFFAVPLLFSALLVHARLAGRVLPLAWLALLCALLMFRAGYEYPYVFPVRDMPRASLVHDAGQLYPKAGGVYVDEEMFAKLRELRELRERYGANYKTMPAFSLSYFLNNDFPLVPSDWLLDWQINAEVDKVYKFLLDRDIVVFMERDQMGVEKPDDYDSRRYSVPLLVSNKWKKLEETRHFVVFKAPEQPASAGEADKKEVPEP